MVVDGEGGGGGEGSFCQGLLLRMFLMLMVMLQSRQELRRLPNRSHTELLAQRLELAA